MWRKNKRRRVYGYFSLSCRKLFFFVYPGQLTHTCNFFFFFCPRNVRLTSLFILEATKASRSQIHGDKVLSNDSVQFRFNKWKCHSSSWSFCPWSTCSPEWTMLLLLLLTLIPKMVIIIFTWWVHQSASHDDNFKVTLEAVHVCNRCCLEGRNYSDLGVVSKPEKSEKQQHFMFSSLWLTFLT